MALDGIFPMRPTNRIFASLALMAVLCQVGCSQRTAVGQNAKVWFWGQCLNQVERDDELGHQFHDFASFVHATGIRWSAYGSVGLSFSSDTEADAKRLLVLIRQASRESPERWNQLVFFEKPIQD